MYFDIHYSKWALHDESDQIIQCFIVVDLGTSHSLALFLLQNQGHEVQ